MHKSDSRQSDQLCMHRRVSVNQIKAKFHYAVQLTSRSQTSSQPNSITLSSLRPAREQVCDQIASWSQTC